jgi:hypothetical protein
MVLPFRPYWAIPPWQYRSPPLAIVSNSPRGHTLGRALRHVMSPAARGKDAEICTVGEILLKQWLITCLTFLFNIRIQF